MAFRLEGPWRAWRVADGRYPLFDGTGAMRHGSRWNSPGRRVIHAAETYAGALLETLVHASGRVPRHHVYVKIEIPASVAMEVVEPGDVPGWDGEDLAASRHFGDRWYDERRSAVLLVPSVVTCVEHNVLIHQEHPDFGRLRTGAPLAVRWDARLWSERPSSGRA
jgi:RES domain-containing protein